MAEAYKKKQPDSSAADDTVIDLSGRRILLVEDNLINREIALRIITETGA